MKKYISPDFEIVLFQTNSDIMDYLGLSGGDYTDPRPTSMGGYSAYGTPGGTVVNNNGAPTFVPGGNGGGGRQTPLG